MVKSWDVFDTLVFRAHGDPQSTWRLVANQLDCPRFLNARIEADRRSQTLEAAYRYLAIQLGWSVPQMEAALNLEVETEIENCHPIVENLQQVSDGDFIISDFYGDRFMVDRILRKCGLTKDVQLWVTPDGKHNGWIWSKLPYRPDVHIGDNPHSDGRSAEAAGIPSVLYDGASLRHLDERLNQPALQLWSRFIRLHCPNTNADAKAVFTEQATLGLPALALFALSLPNEPIAFTYRDCTNLHRLTKLLRPNLDCVGFEASRRLYAEGSPHYVRYIQRTVKDRLIVDLQGSGNSVRAFWRQHFGHEPRLYYLCSPTAPAAVPYGWDGVERFNVSKVGSPVCWLHDGPVRQQCEYRDWHYAMQQNALNIACDGLRFFELQPDLEPITYLCERMEQSVTRRVMPHIQNH